MISEKDDHHFSRIRVLNRIIDEYDGSLPLHHFLKQFYSRHKNFGSTDRRRYSAYVYAFFRTGRAFKGDNTTRFAIGYYLVHGLTDSLAEFIFRKNGIEQPYQGENLKERLDWVEKSFPLFDRSKLFPFEDFLTVDINPEQFRLSMLVQPKVFIRVLPGFEAKVQRELREFNPEVEPAAAGCFSLEPGVNLTNTSAYTKGYFEIQDLSSQLAGSFVPVQTGKEHWWDCCSGAGGKSLQLLAAFPGLNITATDKRSSILENYSLRLKRIPGRNHVIIREANLENSSLNGELYDGIIADVPCSGSGTWSRTPEMFTYFKEENIHRFIKTQRAILNNVLPSLRPGGYLVYITCSVFAAENEENISWLVKTHDMDVVSTKIINGIKYRADSMYAAVLKKKD